MKTLVLSSSSSVKSNTVVTEEDRSPSPVRDNSCYFPGCRKDANCNCEMCLDSINATLDLMPFSIQKSSLTKLSSSKPHVHRTPISFDSSILSTPKSSSPRTPASPVVKLDFPKKEVERERKWGFRRTFVSFLLGLGLILVAEFGFSGILKPVLTKGMVRGVGERSLAVKDLNGRMRFLQRELEGLVDGKISNCSHLHSKWKIDQDGLLLISRCTLYKSSLEEVSVWGWPLQTAGVLATGFSSRSFTILSGRVTEWSDGKIGYRIRKANSSWVHRKWGASVVQLNPNTWILEYRQSSLLENSRLCSAAIEFSSYKISRIVGRMKQTFWFFAAFDSQFGFTAHYNVKTPT